MINKVCYLDLDGVLVDFTKGVLEFHAQRGNKLASSLKYEEMDWDFDKKLGLDPEQFWGSLGYDFWLNLDWTKEGKDILSLLESKFGDNIAILSSPPKTGGAVEGKLAWVAKHLPKYKRRTFIGARKELMAAESKLLVDDRGENCEAFREAGGHVFLVPRPWNGAKQLEHKLMPLLTNYLDWFFKEPV
jgi:5'(3')-deoxyribonucleotidase